MRFSLDLLGFVAVGAVILSCDDGPNTPEMPAEEGSLSVYLTDAPGDVAAVWVDLNELYFQGGPGGRRTVLSESTGLIELTALQDRAVEIVGGLNLSPGNYSQLRFVIGSAVLETTDGSVYAFGGAAHPGSLATTGSLICPSCSSSGLKVSLPGGALAVGDQGNGVVLDFDVAQSFGAPAGESGNWVMQPVVNAVETAPGEDPTVPGAGSQIAGTVVLGNDPGGAPVTMPNCPASTSRSITDFLPIATANTLTDESGGAIVRTGAVADDGTFAVNFVAADDYGMGYKDTLELGTARLLFEATANPANVTVASGSDAGGVAFVITGATCDEDPGTPDPTSPDTIWVATDGSDATGSGGPLNPLATITRAMEIVTDGGLVLVRPGLYQGIQIFRGSFETGVTVRSEVPYQAQLRNAGNRVVGFYSSGPEVAGITLEGFDIAHSGPGAPLVVHLDGDGRRALRRITIRDNVIHDSYDNDLLKVNNSAVDVLIEGNMFYNQIGSDEHIDVNSVEGVIVQDNVFFNDFEGSGRTNPNNTGNFIVIKDSNAAEDIYQGTLDTTVRRNVFMHYQGSSGYAFVQVGEDGMPFHEADGVLVENNLMLGDATQLMRTAMSVKGAKNVTFRHNTVNGDLPSLAFALRLRTEGQNPPNENINFFNNVWTDPTGTMGAESAGGPNDFSDAPPGQTTSFALSNNLYWNGGNPIPSDSGELINFTDDLTGIVADPLLPDPSNAVIPRWNPQSGLFADGSSTIREVRDRLVALYGTPGSGSAALGAADASESPNEDILGQTRGSASVDVGAVQR